MSKELKSLAYITLAIFLWSTIEVLSKFIQFQITPLVLGFIRFFLGTSVLLVVCVLSGRLHLTKGAIYKKWKRFIMIGVALGITIGFFHHGITLTHASSAAVIFSINPIFVASLASLRDEKLSINQILGLTLGFLGAVFIITEAKNISALLSSEYIKGNFLMLISSITWSLYTIYGREYSKEFDALTATLLGFIPATFFLFIAAFLLEDLTLISRLSFLTWSVVIFLGAVVIGVGYLSYFMGLKRVEASKGITLFYLKPALASIFAYLLLGEIFTVWLIAGIVVVSLGIVLAQR